MVIKEELDIPSDVEVATVVQATASKTVVESPVAAEKEEEPSMGFIEGLEKDKE